MPPPPALPPWLETTAFALSAAPSFFDPVTFRLMLFKAWSVMVFEASNRLSKSNARSSPWMLPLSEITFMAPAEPRLLVLFEWMATAPNCERFLFRMRLP